MCSRIGKTPAFDYPAATIGGRADREIAASPAWSIHFGARTANYRFVWAMGGENQAFDDMDGISVTKLR